MLCYCASNKNFLLCCAPFLKGETLPETPEALMRSRYTAFALKDMDYIEKTMRGKALQKADLHQTQTWLEHVIWKNLTIIKTEVISPESGIVHFVAEYEENGVPHVLEEISEFKKIEHQWYYVKAKHLKSRMATQTIKVGRNDPCPCKSGKKYKHCCVTTV